MSAKKAVKRRVVPAPQDLNGAVDFVRQMGEVQRKVEEADRDMNDRVEEVKQPFIDQVAVLQDELERLFEGLYAYASGHRTELTDTEKRKTVQLPTGSFGWRWTPKSVVIKDKDAILAQLEALGLQRFIRVKKEPDKEAMLKEEPVAAAVDGVSIVQHEEFVVKPAQVTAEIAATAGKRKLKLIVSSGAGSNKKEQSA